MTSESSLWRTARANLSPHGVFRRVENRAGDGTPDVAYCVRGASGWIELKELDAWPKRVGTPVRIPSLTRDQVDWLEAWSGAGGRAWLLMQVGRDYLMLPPLNVRQVFDRTVTRNGLAGCLVGFGRFPTAEVLKCLTRT